MWGMFRRLLTVRGGVVAAAVVLLVGMSVPETATAVGAAHHPALVASSQPDQGAAADSQDKSSKPPKPPKPKPPKPPVGEAAAPEDISSSMPRTMRDDLTADFLGRGYDQRMRAENSD